MFKMTPKEARAIIKETKTDHALKHCVMRGLQILSETNPLYDGTICAEHDQIWACDISFEDSVANMSAEQVKEMSTLGWFVDENGWSHWV